MKRISVFVLCLAGALASAAHGQGSPQEQSTTSQNLSSRPPQKAAATENQPGSPSQTTIGTENQESHSQVANQARVPEPVRVAAGEVLTFYLQARLNPTGGDGVDGLPKGTLLRVKMLGPIDSAVDADGAEFYGTVESGLVSSGELVIRSGSQVRGILALLRSRSHPEGFRYELLITDLTDHGKSYSLTASLKPSLADLPVAAKPADGAGQKSSESGASH